MLLTRLPHPLANVSQDVFRGQRVQVWGVGQNLLRTVEPLQMADANLKRWASGLCNSPFWWELNKTPTAMGRIAFKLPIGHPQSGFAGRVLADVGIRQTWPDVGPCRVRLASLTDWAIFRLCPADEEQFANLTFVPAHLAVVPEYRD